MSNASELIYDYFVYDNRLIAVLNNKDAVGEYFKNLLLLAEVKSLENGNVLSSLNTEEYDEIKDYYMDWRNRETLSPYGSNGANNLPPEEMERP